MNKDEQEIFVQNIKNENPEFSDEQVSFLVDTENLKRMRQKAKELGLSPI